MVNQMLLQPLWNGSRQICTFAKSSHKEKNEWVEAKNSALVCPVE
jgi:hypothetical protein